MLARRKALSPAERDAASHLAQQQLLSLPEFAAAGTVALYAAIHNEVETAELFAAASASGKMLLFPAVCGANLTFRSVAGPEQLQRGRFGILEPNADCPPASHLDADLLVIPAVAYALNGQRIGYGKGFYDKALHELEGSGRLVGLCYDFQLVDAFPGEPHDVCVDLIVTETRVVYPRYLS